MGSLTKATTETFGPGGVNSTNIQNEAITNAKIASDAAIANSKLTITFPTISSLSITNGQPAVYDTETVDINGTDFTNGARVDFIHSTTNAVINLPTVTFVSATQLRVTIPASTLTEGTDYKIRVSNPDGLAATSIGTVLYSETVSFSTSSGSLGSVGEGESASFSVSASSNSAISYSVTSGSLPTGLSLNSSTGAITGTAPSVSADTVSSFTITATDAESQTASRSFSITVTNFVIDNSLRFNDNDSAYLTRSTGTTNKRTFTVSVWVKRTTLNARQTIWASDQNTNDTGDGSKGGSGNYISFWNNGEFYFGGFGGSFQVRADGLQRDVSAWYHIVAQTDTTQATTNDRGKLWINGVQQTTYTSMIGQNTDVKWATNRIGVRSDVANYSDSVNLTAYADGYIAELHVVDGQALTASDFGETDSTTGAWVPKKYTGTYGTDGYYLDFSNSADLGNDSSGNNNDFTPSNLAATDQTSDTPTNNFCTLNPLRFSGSPTYSEGNLKAVTTSEAEYVSSSIAVKSGKWYWETRFSAITTIVMVGVQNVDVPQNTTFYQSGRFSYGSTGSLYYNSASESLATYTTGDIIGIALDMDGDSISWYKNNTLVTTKTLSSYTIDTSKEVEHFIMSGASGGSAGLTVSVNYGQNGSFNGTETAQGNSDENGYGDFYYTPPTGYLALCTNNLPNPAIADPSEHFNTVLYSGNSSVRSITGVGFQPDWIWIKSRSNASWHALQDSSRGSLKTLFSNESEIETTYTDSVTSFDSDGFSMGDDSEGGSINVSSRTYVAWNWKANAGSTSSNTDGSITSTVQANTTAGFSIVTYTGTGSNATIGHGLGVAPKMIICKQRNNTLAHDWIVYHESIGNTDVLQLNQDYAKGTYSVVWNNTSPTSSVFSVGTAGSVNESGKNQLAYCFAEIEGYSKFGAWVGNGSTTDANRPFIYTGFRPAFVLWKDTNSATDWRIIDNKRNSYNVANSRLFPNSSSAENSAYSAVMDFLSNGFKIRGTHTTGINTSGNSYIYMAFAENPFVTSGATPVTAR